MKKINQMEQALTDIKNYFKNWLVASNLTEEDFLSFRTCKKYTLDIKECIQNEKEGIAVFVSYGENQEPIGLPFWVGYDNSEDEKEQFFVNTALVLIYMASQLDRANQQNPVSGSYTNGYFMLKTRSFLPRLMEQREPVLSV